MEGDPPGNILNATTEGNGIIDILTERVMGRQDGIHLTAGGSADGIRYVVEH